MDNIRIHSDNARAANHSPCYETTPPALPSVRYFQVHFEFLAENLAEMRREMAELKSRLNDWCEHCPQRRAMAASRQFHREHPE